MVEGRRLSLLYSSEYRAGLNRLDMAGSSTVIQKQHFDRYFFFFQFPDSSPLLQN